MMRRLHEIASAKCQANCATSEVEEKGSELFAEWDLALASELIARDDTNMNREQNRAAMNSTEDRAGLVSSPPSLHMSSIGRDHCGKPTTYSHDKSKA